MYNTFTSINNVTSGFEVAPPVYIPYHFALCLCNNWVEYGHSMFKVRVYILSVHPCDA